MSSNDNARPPIPVPAGGFSTNEDEARRLEQTLIMRLEETITISLGLKAKIQPSGLYDLLLIALNAASRRRPPAHGILSAESTTARQGRGNDG